MNASYDGHHVPNPNNPNKWAPGLNFNMLNAANGSAYQQKRKTLWHFDSKTYLSAHYPHALIL